MKKWIQTGTVAPHALSAARRQLHYAALILGSTSDSILDPADDDSQTNLGFDPATRSLFTHALEPQHNLVVHLELPTLTLEIRKQSATTDRLALEGQALTTAVDWIHDRLVRRAGLERAITLREYPGFPDSTLASGAAFDPPAEAELTEIAVWFANGLAMLESPQPDHATMSAIRVWPHHLDLGALIPLDGGDDQMIGLGLSPGDGYYDQPYFYCTPHPVPSTDDARPQLRTGHWHTRDFISAIATAEELQAGQGEAAREYLTDAIAACRSLVG